MSDFGLARSEIESAIQCTTDEHLLHHLNGALAGVQSLIEQLEAAERQRKLAQREADDKVEASLAWKARAERAEKQYGTLRAAAEYVMDGYDISHVDDAHLDHAVESLRLVLSPASGEDATAGRLNPDLSASPEAAESYLRDQGEGSSPASELRATLAESVTPHGVGDLHDAPASEEELPSGLPLGLTQSRHKDILSNVSNRTIAAIDRLEARGGWDEGDLNDFAIVREAISNRASESKDCGR